jgi:predicted ATP-binding protein involved in virulence
MAFSYIKQIKVNNCYTYKDFSIPKVELTEFKHIILTGRNASGKTTILNRIAFLLSQLQNGNEKSQRIRTLNAWIVGNPKDGRIDNWKKELSDFNDIELSLFGDSSSINKNSENYIISYFKAHRKMLLTHVSTVTREDEFLTQLKNDNNAGDFISKFKQYLVNKKVYEAFDYMNSKSKSKNTNSVFFENLTETLRNIFHDDKLELEFVQESFEFYLILKDSRKVTFNQLSEGFSAFLSVLIDLLMKTDLIRKTQNDYSLEPEGIVIIDEPETHLHLGMQYEILPLISKLFPKIQLIVASHSPAIISSLKGAIVYDLTTKYEVSDWVLGSSFSELMINHFGLENEYSPIADKIILEINDAVKKKDVNELKQILSTNENYLTSSLRLEIESQIIHIQSR